MVQITETINPLSVKKMSMTTDDDGFTVPPPLQKSNFFYILNSQPRGGKTNLWLNFIKLKKKYYHKQFHEIYIFSNSLHTIKEKLSLPESHIIHGFDIDRLGKILDEAHSEREEDIAQKRELSKILIIFDDVVAQIAKNLQPMLHLLYNRRHIGGGCSIILTSQKFNKIPLEIRTVATAIFFFGTKNKQEIDTLWKEYINMSRKDFVEVLSFVFTKPHNFLYMNLEEPEKDMFYKNFNHLKITLPEEDMKLLNNENQ